MCATTAPRGRRRLFGAVDGVQRLIATRAAPTPTTPSGTPNLHAATMDALQRMKLLTGVPESLPAPEPTATRAKSRSPSFPWAAPHRR
ncbi:MAG: hypothetical protein WKH64_05460 [Chloroflexia bacterium]